MGYVKTCCDAVPQGKSYYRQARSLATNSLVNEWFPVDRIPGGPADFKLFSYLSNQCLKIVYADAVSDTAGILATKWDAIGTVEEEALLCSGGSPPADVYVPLRSFDGSGGSVSGYRDLAFSFLGPLSVGGATGSVVTATAIGTVTFNYLCDRATATCHHALQVYRVRAGVPAAVSGVFSDTRDGGGGSVSFSVQTGDVLRVYITAASGGCAARYHDEAGVSSTGDNCPDDPPATGTGPCVLVADMTALKAAEAQWSALDDTPYLSYDVPSATWIGPGRFASPSEYGVRIEQVVGGWKLHVTKPSGGYSIVLTSGTGGFGGTYSSGANDTDATTASTVFADIDVTTADPEQCRAVLYTWTADCDGTTKRVNRTSAVCRYRGDLRGYDAGHWLTPFGVPTYYRLGPACAGTAVGTDVGFAAAGADPAPPDDGILDCS